MSSSLSPLVLIVPLGLLLALGALFAAWRVRSVLAKVALVMVALVGAAPSAWLLLAHHPELIDARYRAYKAFYRDIELGMTRDEVFALLERHYPESGERGRPRTLPEQPDEIVLFMDPEESREPTVEGILLDLEDGRVARKRYSPD
jgi:hypothetical protein